MVHKTKELSKEKKKTDSLLYQMVPRQVAKSLKERKDVDAEYFKSVTILFSEIMDFMRLTTMLSPMNIVALLNEIHTAIDEQLDNHDVYKVETINDCYMVASGELLLWGVVVWCGVMGCCGELLLWGVVVWCGVVWCDVV